MKFTKPLNLAMVVKEDKVKEFKAHKPDKKKLKRIFKMAEEIQKNIVHKE